MVEIILVGVKKLDIRYVIFIGYVIRLSYLRFFNSIFFICKVRVFR